MSHESKHELLTVAEAAAFLKVRPRTVTRYRKDGKLPFVMYSSRKFLYRREDLAAFRDNCYHQPSLFDL